jgi:chaperonin GroEL (HSP60 family)
MPYPDDTRTVARTNRHHWITHEVERTGGTDARQANIAAGKALAKAIQTTLGPSGRDKMLIGSNGTVVITNDGASILDRMDIDDPTAKMVADVAATQDRTVGDGTTTAVLLTGELLAKAEKLLDRGLHPTTIIAGYHHAVGYARKRLEEYGIKVEGNDDEMLQAVVRTTVTGKWDDASAERFAALTTEGVRAIETDGRIDSRNLTITALPGGELRESELIDGLLVDMDTSSTTIEGFDIGLPRTLADARLALVNDEITIEAADISASVTVSNPRQRENLQAYESETRAAIVQRIIDLDTDVLFCQKSIDAVVRTKLAHEGILTVERTRQDEFDALARTTAATAMQSVEDLSSGDIGYAGSVERRSLGVTELLTISEGPGDTQASILLRGGTEHVAEETRRIIEDCIAVAQHVIHNGRVLPGGGAIEMALTRDLLAYADGVSGRKQLAVEAFAEALEGVPQTLVVNAGLDPFDVLADLRNHHEENPSVGIDSLTGELRDMARAQVFEPMLVKDRCLTNALEATAMILRVDEIIQAKQSSSRSEAGDHNHMSNKHTRQSTGGYPWAIGH